MGPRRFRPGVTFGDFVIQDSKTIKSKIRDDKPADYRRGWLIFVTVMVAFVVVWVRLASLQVFYGDRFRVLSEQNRVKRIKLQAPRGKIFDRNGQILADNEKVTQYSEEEKLSLDYWRRVYPQDKIAAHVVGYLGEIGETEVGFLKEEEGKYTAKDMIGRSGIEAWYEEGLRGVDGGRLIEVANTGEVVRELGKKEPVPGRDLKLALDIDLQRVALEALDGKKGAVVASNPKTGEVLVLTSAPSFNPTDLNKSLADESLPLFNRAIGGVYPPGSTFKMVTTMAAIGSGKVRSDFSYEDTGIITVGSFRYTNWLFTKRGGTEGVVGFSRALARSTDTFFYKVGEMTTPEVMAQWAGKMGYGEKTGIDLPGEVEGLIATPEWKKRVIGDNWFLGNTYHMAIGQGDLLATPVQVNLMTNILATRGLKCPLRMVGGADICERVELDETAMKLIESGMNGACSEGGTAFPLFDFEPQVACKTGTAEYMTSTGKMRTHGWLTAYAPASDPTITVTVVVEGGGEGSNVAAPVVRKILAKYFNVEDNYNYAAIPQEISE